MGMRHNDGSRFMTDIFNKCLSWKVEAGSGDLQQKPTAPEVHRGSAVYHFPTLIRSHLILIMTIIKNVLSSYQVLNIQIKRAFALLLLRRFPSSLTSPSHTCVTVRQGCRHSQTPHLALSPEWVTFHMYFFHFKAHGNPMK